MGVGTLLSERRATLIPYRGRMSTSKLYIDPAHVAASEKDDWAKFAHLSSDQIALFLNFVSVSAFARIENHYFINEAFMRDGQLLDSQEIDKMCVVSFILRDLT